ncbi:MAG: hypothetical protein KJS87_09170 [Alphaproteobacteria bacterium]|nr:hypothetical protein [Alphaproteobacteria bacterium]
MRNWLAACLILASATPAFADRDPLAGKWRAVTIAPEPATQVTRIDISLPNARDERTASIWGRCSAATYALRLVPPISTCKLGFGAWSIGGYPWFPSSPPYILMMHYTVVGRSPRSTGCAYLAEIHPADGDRLMLQVSARQGSIHPSIPPFELCPPESRPLPTVYFERMPGTFPLEVPRQPPSIPSQRPPSSNLPTLPRQPPSIPNPRVPGMPQ